MAATDATKFLNKTEYSDALSRIRAYIDAKAQPLDADLTAIAGLTGTSGLLKKTAANTWTFDTNTYLTTSNAASTYLHLSGGTLTGALKWSGSTALPATTEASYFLTIDAFASGGQTKYITAANLASSIGLGNYLPLSGGTLTGNLTISKDTTADLNIKSNTSGVPSLTFTRGTQSDSYTDWRIRNESGYLYFSSNTSGTWTDRVTLSSNGLHAVATNEVVTNLNANFLQGYSSKEILLSRINNATSGILVKTTIAVASTNIHLYFTIQGKTHSSKNKPIFTFGSLYYNGSNGTINYLRAIDAGFALGSISAFIYETYLYLWFQQPETYCSIFVGVYTSSGANRVDTLTNAAIPSTGVSETKTITTTSVASDYLPLTGGTLTGNITISSETSGTPTLTLQRGTASDNYVDHKISSSGGALGFSRSASGTDTLQMELGSTALYPVGTLTSSVSEITLGNTTHYWGAVYAKEYYVGSGSACVRSSAATNIYFSNSSGAVLVVDGKVVRRNTVSSMADTTLGSATYPWGNVYSSEMTIMGGSSATPTLNFVRGTASDTYVDWKVSNNGGAFQFIRSASGTDTAKAEVTGAAFRPRGIITNSVSDMTLGESTYRWGTLYTSAINASDLSTLAGGLVLGTSANAIAAKMEWDETNNAWKLNGNFYATGFVSAGGINSSSGGGTSSDPTLRMYPSNINGWYPILTRYNTTTGESYYTEYGRYTNEVTINPSTGYLSATTFGALNLIETQGSLDVGLNASIGGSLTVSGDSTFSGVTVFEDSITIDGLITLLDGQSSAEYQYLRYKLCASEAAYNAIATKQSDVLYLIPES